MRVRDERLAAIEIAVQLVILCLAVIGNVVVLVVVLVIVRRRRVSAAGGAAPRPAVAGISHSLTPTSSGRLSIIIIITKTIYEIVRGVIKQKVTKHRNLNETKLPSVAFLTVRNLQFSTLYSYKLVGRRLRTLLRQTFFLFLV